MLLALLLVVAQLPPPLAKPLPALQVYPSMNNGLPIAGAGECPAGDGGAGVAMLGSYGEAVTFTRATGASCTKSDGTLVQLTAGQAALSGGSVKMRAAVTNRAIRSEALDSWVAGSSTVTPDTTTAPDGLVTMDTVLTPSGYGPAITASVTSGTGPWTYSAWGASVDGGMHAAGLTAQCTAANPDGGATLVASCSCALADGGTCTPTILNQSCGSSATFGPAATRMSITFSCVTANTNLTLAAPGAAFIASGSHAWGLMQLETGSTASDYCGPTGATAAVCNAEVASVHNALADPPANPGQWCITSTIEAGKIGTGDVGDIGTTGANTAYLGHGYFGVFDSTGTQKYIAITGTGAGTYSGCTVDGTLAVYRDGASVGGAVAGAGTGIIATQPATVYVGDNSTGAFPVGAWSNFKLTRGVSP